MERIYVTVRARPLSSEESKTSPWRISANSISLTNQPSKFEFDRIFGEDCKTAYVYEARTKEIVASAVRGFNGTVFAYGQTSSGKTHTMRGSVAEPGIIPLAVYDLFKSIEEDVEREFLVRMSYMEIYNEEINDLLAPEHRKLQIHENIERGIYVAGLREEIVASPEQVLDLMEFGESHRHIGETNMNLYSSRSHTIFRMIVESREIVEDRNSDNSCDAVRVSVLNLVDLAGSERVAKTGAEGVRLKEGSHINKSLLTLGTVIKKLSEGAENQGLHVPYRDSKLTRILQPALGGNSNTAIICNITLAQVHTDETKSSLQFASRALRVTNCACVNEILTDAALLRRQRKEIEELTAKLLSSNSEHFEEEILNLRNILLQSEVEKERITLELEEEKKAKAHHERTLLEQAKKIANLSSLVLNSERDEKSTAYPSKDQRRLTWCPGPLKSMNEYYTPHPATASHKSRKREQDIDLPPFEELIQESDSMCGPDQNQNDFLFPDAGALLRVTSRRKVHLNRNGSLPGIEESVEKYTESENHILDFDSQVIESEISRNTIAEITPTKANSTPLMSCLSGDASFDRKNRRELEAILVIKQLQDKIKSLEMEKTFIQRNLDNVVELATQQSASFREKYEELNEEVLNEREKARVAHEELCSVASIGSLKQEAIVDSSSKLYLEIQGVASQVDDSRTAVESMLSSVGDAFQNFSIVSKLLMELKSFATDDIVQFKTIIDGHKKVENSMRKKINALELEKNLLSDQSVDHQKKNHELKLELDNLEKGMEERSLQHDLEKDELLCQILSLQKEVSSLSSSSLVREKESLGKDLDKTKSKLKDIESKFKNAIQEKIKLESEKAHAEREIKHLRGQRANLERDILKRDSLIDKRNEPRPSDCSRTKGFPIVLEQSLQEDYKRLEVYAFEMEAKVASLDEALVNAIEEKEDAFHRNHILDSELEDMTSKFSVVDSELLFLKEELATTLERLEESESIAKNLEASLALLSREKEEMAMQLTDALLEVEAEKSTWLVKEKGFTECNERLKISNNEIAKLSTDLLEVTHEVESYREQCAVLRERLDLSNEIAEREQSCNTTMSLEIAQLRNEVKEHTNCLVKYEEIKSKLELILPEHNHACEEVKKLQEQLTIIFQEKEKLSIKVMELGRGLNLFDDRQEALNNNKEIAKLRVQVRSIQAKLDAYRGRFKEVMDEKELMNKNFEEASSKLKKQLASYGVEILRLTKELASKD